jgi:hypothetical protein
MAVRIDAADRARPSGCRVYVIRDGAESRPLADWRSMIRRDITRPMLELATRVIPIATP